MKKSGKLHDAERHAVLAAVHPKADMSVDNSNVGAYRTKVVTAGEFLYVSCYPLIGRTEWLRQEREFEALKRSEKAKERVKYARYNNARRLLTFEQLVQHNFGRGDFHVTCTYEMPSETERWYGEPEYRDREEAKRDCDNFIRRVKRLMKRHGHDPSALRYIKVTVTKEYDKESMRPFPDAHHHHILLGGIPENLRGDVERLWPFGYCNADRLQPDGKGIAAMAGYVGRQEGRANGNHRAGEKSWSGSKNLRRPEVRVSDVKISRRRAAKIAEDVRANGREILEKIWTGYALADEVKVMVSDFVAGAYIQAVLRQKRTVVKRD